MEGNECYKFSTIRNYLDILKENPISVAIDIGCNVGDITKMMRHYFPDANIFGFEAVEDYYKIAKEKCKNDDKIEIHCCAITSQHLYEDDLGLIPRSEKHDLKLLRGIKSTLGDDGLGYIGGSVIVPIEYPNNNPECYKDEASPDNLMTLDQVVNYVLNVTGKDMIDYIKFDCEGCEHTSLGAVSIETLKKIRFMSGEYHNFERFYEILDHKLFYTHKVNLIGDGGMGSFFAELRSDKVGILKENHPSMKIQRHWLYNKPITWNIFNEMFVLPHERGIHAI